jgi:exonuclease III
MILVSVLIIIYVFQHCKIRSLSANFDNLLNMISELCYSFSLIGLIETIKFKVDQPRISNIDILGYQFISQPSHSLAGGVGFYVKNRLSYKVRTDLTTSKDEFEALWIEIQNKGKANIICGVVYRHPRGDLDTFIEYLNSGIEKINQGDGGFNVDRST